MQLERIKALCQENKILWIIEDYPDDHPYPNCLLLGAGPLHVVCGMAEDRLFIITAYRPDPSEWGPDYKTRKEGKV